jgi:diguanylate cyclase (GGDEF)-like protein
MKVDWSQRSRARIYVFTVLGTVACMAFAITFDSYSFTTGTWRWGSNPINNVLIPLLIAPPFFYFLLSQMRQLAVAHEEAVTLATLDGLTCLLNRRAFAEMVDGYFERAQKASIRTNGALLVIDVDHFKLVNDEFGHDIGDQALRLIATTISSSVREADLVGRIGGEEFCVFIPGQPPETIRVAAERLRQAVNEAAFVVRGQRHNLSVSVGGVFFDRNTTFNDLYREADERLYSAKRAGRNRVALRDFHSAMTVQPTMH